MEDGLDVVAVRVQHVGGVVAVAVLGARSRRAVVAAAGVERRRVEGVDGLAAVAFERDVRAAGGAALMDPEVVAAVGAEARRAVVGVDVRDLLHSERPKRARIELDALVEVPDSDAEVVDDSRAFRHPQMFADGVKARGAGLPSRSSYWIIVG